MREIVFDDPNFGGDAIGVQNHAWVAAPHVNGLAVETKRVEFLSGEFFNMSSSPGS
jgi:hypothetical protein